MHGAGVEICAATSPRSSPPEEEREFRFPGGRTSLKRGVNQSGELKHSWRTFCLAGGRYERCSSIDGGVVEVDFFDEAGGKLIVGEIDVLAGVEAGAAVFSHPPKGHGAKHGDGRVGSGARGEGLEDVGPNYWVAVEDGGAVWQPLIDVLLGCGLECGELRFPGA